MIPKIATLSYLNGPDTGCANDTSQCSAASKALWHSVWMTWHYTAISLTHSDALLTTGIVESGLPAALSSTLDAYSAMPFTSINHSSACWELGKPRAKHQRDVYADRDVTRIVSHDTPGILESIGI